MSKDASAVIRREDGVFQGSFTAMASPCELLVDTLNRQEAEHLYSLAKSEALRIEHKFSRYRTDNIVHEINASNGSPVELDAETCHLVEFAATLFDLSEGFFDITSGVLRRAWTFDGGSKIPDRVELDKLIQDIGWTKLDWESPFLTLPKNMQIDFGGIGKEYAVDRIRLILSNKSKASCLINLGGDLAITWPRSDHWSVGVESTEGSENPIGAIALHSGAVATSGDARRFVMQDSKRLGHILNPKTGWPIEDAPGSVTVAAKTCVEAGMFATLGILKGKDCREFLENQNLKFWIQD